VPVLPTTARVRFDEALRTIFGLAEVPSVSTFTRFFRRFDRRQVDEVLGHLSRWFWDRLSAQTWTMSLLADSAGLLRALALMNAPQKTALLQELMPKQMCWSWDNLEQIGK